MPAGEIAEEARREEEAEERFHPAAQEGGAVARESEVLLGGYPTAELDLPAHRHHDTLDNDDLAAAADLNLSEWEATPDTASRPAPLQPDLGMVGPPSARSVCLQAARAPQRPSLSRPSPCSCAGNSPGWALPALAAARQRGAR